jgi:hypothetical protein
MKGSRSNMRRRCSRSGPGRNQRMTSLISLKTRSLAVDRLAGAPLTGGRRIEESQKRSTSRVDVAASGGMHSMAVFEVFESSLVFFSLLRLLDLNVALFIWHSTHHQCF